jgi:hypothetical protein
VLTCATHSTLPTTATPLALDRGVAFDDARALLAASGRADEPGGGGGGGRACPDGFYRSRRELYGRDMYILALRRPGQRHLFGVTRPNTGASFFEFDREELRSKYVHIPDAEQAREGWTALYDSTLAHCMHGPGCERGAACGVGRRLTRVTIISGAVVPIWSTLEAVLKRHEHTLTKSDRAMRAVRVELSDDVAAPGGAAAAGGGGSQGEAGGGAAAAAAPAPPGATTVLVGIRFPEKHLDEVTQRLLPAPGGAALPGGLAAGAAGASGGASGSAPQRRVDPPGAVDAKALAKAMQKPRTLHDFFSKGPAAPAAGAGGGGAGGGGVGAGPKRPPAAAPAPAGAAKKARVSSGGAGAAAAAGATRFVGPFAFAAAPPRACPVCGAALTGSNAADNRHVDACVAGANADSPNFDQVIELE